jgi:hypothetical protein
MVFHHFDFTITALTYSSGFLKPVITFLEAELYFSYHEGNIR